jgi:hypothetical protein
MRLARLRKVAADPKTGHSPQVDVSVDFLFVAVGEEALC